MKMGRKPIYGNKTINKSYSLSQEVVEWLKTKENKSEFVNSILKERMERESNGSSG